MIQLAHLLFFELVFRQNDILDVDILKIIKKFCKYREVKLIWKHTIAISDAAQAFVKKN